MKTQENFKTKLSTILNKKPVKLALVLVVVSGLGATGYFLSKPVMKEVKESKAVQQIEEKGFVKTYFDTFFSIVHKLSELEHLDRSNEELSQKIAVLEKEVEEEKSKNTQDEAKEITAHLSEKLKGEAGSELARVLQSIEYKPPTHLLPHQLYALGLGYFRKQEHEQAAVIFSYLTDLKEDTSYQRAEVYLMSAISWYKIKHFTLASEYTKKTLKKSDEDTSVHRKALLWDALVNQAQGEKEKSQHILTSMVARFPHSEEVAWINHRGDKQIEKKSEKEASREPTSKNEHDEHFAARKANEESMHEKHEESAATPAHVEGEIKHHEEAGHE